MAATAAVVDLRFLCPKSPKWNPLTLLYLPMPSASGTVAGSAVSVELRELVACCHGGTGTTGTTSLFWFPDPLPPVSFVLF